MLALKNFLQYGVHWQGSTNDVEYMQTRAARVLLLSLADQISARDPFAGVKTGRPGLTGFTYEKSTVSAVLARLIKTGILAWQRASRRGGRHEEFATTLIAPLLIEHAIEWQRACIALKKSGKRGVNARPAKSALQIPLISTAQTGESTTARLAAGERPDIGPISVQKLDTISIFTPPLPFEAPGINARDESGESVCAAFPLHPILSVLPACSEAEGGCDASSSSFSRRPYFPPQNIFEFRRFCSWLLTVNKSDTLTLIVLIQPSKRGRLEVFANQTSRTGQRDCGLTSVKPEKVFMLAFARSADVFADCGEGEQVFFAPRPGSRVILLDDLRTDQPVITDTPSAILETSEGNYQHFYVAARSLNVEERGQMQAELARKHGADLRATGGAQPHRCPGSVNYKQGRNLFATRLVFLSLEGRALPFMYGNTADTTTENTIDLVPRRGVKAAGASSLAAQGDASAVDWAWVKRNVHLGAAELIKRLSVTAAERGKHADYARRTVEKAMSS